MRTFDLIKLLAPEVVPAKTKIHLATWNGIDEPLDLLRAGTFEPWQASQNNRNFEREFVVALVAMPESHHWMFGGAYRSRGVKPKKGKTREWFLYDLERIAACDELMGRLVSRFERPGRNSYLLGEAWAEAITVSEIRAEPLRIADFPGFKFVHLKKHELDTIVRDQTPSWRAALSSVGGVYLICDEESGQLYVGSAYGEGGFWQRWTQYADNGHGGNVELREMLKCHGPDRCASFWYSILEIADVATSEGSVLAREAHWKRVLLSRVHGLNAN